MTSVRTLGPYQIIRPLAAGGMAQVFLAKKTGEGGFEMTCVVKTIHEAHARDEAFVQMFLREARILASLRHQNIVQVLDFGRVDQTLYLAMEYIEGRDLREVLAEARASGVRPPLPVALHIAMEALGGLDYAHRRTGPDGWPLNIVHRDLTPSNILLSREGEVKLVDFGIAKDAASADFTEIGSVKGKLPYLSPEQLDGRELDGRADVFAMGVVLYEMAAGRRPFDAETSSAIIGKILRGDYPPLSMVAGTPVEFDALLARALAANPANRFASAAAMLAALEKFAVRFGPFPATGLRDYFQTLYPPAHGALADDESGHYGDTELILLRAPAEPGEARPAQPPLAIPAAPPAGEVAVRRAGWRRAAWFAVAAVAAVAAAIASNTYVRYLAVIPASRVSPPPAASTPPDQIAAEKLEPATLDVQAAPGTTVWLDSTEIGQTPLAPLPVKPGMHQIRLVNRALGTDYTVQRNFETGATTTINEDATKQ